MIGLQELPTVRKHKRLNEYSSASNLSAAFSQSWTETPISSIWRDRELRLANIGQGEVKYTYTNPLMGQDVAIPQTQERKQLSKEEVEARIKQEGLPLKSPEEGYTEEALDLIVERKRNEIYRADQMSRAKGFLAGPSEFAAAMAAQILDPINIAASFIPVVGPARYTSMLTKATTRLGRAGVRARVGAIEGVVGAAIVEPLVYRAMTKEQADYDMYDSLLNIGLGAVVGGGLHSGFGAVSDAITKGTNPRVALQTKQPQGPNAQMLSKASPETKRSMLSTAISQELRGVPTNIEPILNHKHSII